MKIKKILVLLISAYSILACAQKRELKKEEIMKEENIQKVLKIGNEIKTYNYNPAYILNIGKAAGFSFEILVNDILFYKHFDTGNITGSMPLVDNILKSGKQKIKIRMFPKVDKDYNLKTLIEPREIALELKIMEGDNGRAQGFNDYKEKLKFTLPKFSRALPYYEVNLEFEARLPYELEGWSNGIDLTKEDKDKLLLEVENFYREIIKYYETGNVNALAGKYYKRQKEMGQALYETKESNYEYLVEAWVKGVNREQVFEFDNYELRFFGNGKIVALLKNTAKYRSYPALFSENDKLNNIYYYNMFLYRPKPGSPLEVIR